MVVGVWSGSAAPRSRGWPPHGRRRKVHMLRVPDRLAEWIHDYAGASGDTADAERDSGFRSAVGAPISVEDRPPGVMSVASTREEPLSLYISRGGSRPSPSRPSLPSITPRPRPRSTPRGRGSWPPPTRRAADRAQPARRSAATPGRPRRTYGYASGGGEGGRTGRPGWRAPSPRRRRPGRSCAARPRHRPGDPDRRRAAAAPQALARRAAVPASRQQGGRAADRACEIAAYYAVAEALTKPPSARLRRRGAGAARDGDLSSGSATTGSAGGTPRLGPGRDQGPDGGARRADWAGQPARGGYRRADRHAR